MTPSLLESLLDVARLAGELSCAPLTYYRRKELSAKTKRDRILWVARGRFASLRMDEVDVVLRGARLDKPRERFADGIRAAAIVDEALDVYAAESSTRSPLTAELATAYKTAERACPSADSRRWFAFTARERARLLDLHLETATPTPEVRKLFDWVAGEPLVHASPVLRAATYFWGMSELFSSWHSVSAVLVHELRVGDVDRHGLLSLTSATDAQVDLQRARARGAAIASTGDFTAYFENFTAALAKVMRERVALLGRITDNAEYLPWQVVAPPDALEARVFEVIERLGTAGSAAIIAGLSTRMPPLRTLQRRLQKMVRERTIVKHGARKTATYSVPARDAAA